MRALGILICFAGLTCNAQAPAVQLTLDTSEATEALRILDLEAAHTPITAADWQRLFATAPYQWLKLREADMGRSFTDEDFESFLLSTDTLAKRGEWRQTLAGLEQSDMTALGTNVLAWLPPGAAIHARVFPEIKPAHNSFVWTKPGEGPAIFLYLEHQSKDKFENTVAHECHHIGLESVTAELGSTPEAKSAIKWLGGLGEGEAMLAAAGSSDRHPHWEDDALARARWDADMMHFNTDLEAIQQLILDILDSKLTSAAEIQKRAAPFWGDVQGAWYTVGYEMSALVERHHGREAFTDCLLDPRQLLVKYNEIAKNANAKGATLATWSPQLLSRLK